MESLRYQHSKTIAHCLLITRSDGVELAFTDHDRQLTFEGRLYRPIVMGSLSADRRESGLRSGDQDAAGIIDEINITTTDLDAQNFLGAEVRQVLLDWRKPNVVFARHRRWIRKITRTGASFTATLEGRAQQLQRPQAGRFGGFFTTKCQYRLGGPFCKKDIAQWTQIAIAGPTAFGPTTSTSIDEFTDTTKTWTINQWVGYFVELIDIGSAAGSGQLRKIISNSPTNIYVDQPFDVLPINVIGYRIGLGPAVATVARSRYEFTFNVSDFPGTYSDQFYRDGSIIWTTGANAGVVSAIADYRHSDRKIVLLMPTPFDITIGARGVVRVGCDGLLGTCRDKFQNVLNFGGDPYAPSVQQMIEPPEEQ